MNRCIKWDDSACAVSTSQSGCDNTVYEYVDECATSLITDGPIVNPAKISYNSAGSVINISSGYTDIFTHTNEVNCPLTTC